MALTAGTDGTPVDSAVHRLVERLHASPTMAVVVVTGAAAQSIAWLLGVPGASRTVLEALVPYASPSLVGFLGYGPEQYVSAQTARDMARRAYQRALRLRKESVPVVGVGCTATIVTDRPKRGEHRCHVAAWSERGVTTYSLQLVKGLRDRQGEEDVVSRLVLRALAEASGVEYDLPIGLDARERVEVASVAYDDPLSALLASHVSTVTIGPDGRMAADAPVRGAVLAGSFNPLHQGHERLASVASRMLGVPVTYELSVTNVDKPTLTRDEVDRRVSQFAGRAPIVVTRALTFIQKARLFPGCTFVIGWDTAVRLVEPRYYEGDRFKMLSALVEIGELGCRFLVAGRVDGGVFHTLADVPIPDGLEGMFTPIPESDFRADISSTQLRQAGQVL